MIVSSLQLPATAGFQKCSLKKGRTGSGTPASALDLAILTRTLSDKHKAALLAGSAGLAAGLAIPVLAPVPMAVLGASLGLEVGIAVAERLFHNPENVLNWGTRLGFWGAVAGLTAGAALSIGALFLSHAVGGWPAVIAIDGVLTGAGAAAWAYRNTRPNE